MCEFADVQMCEFFKTRLQKRIRTFAHQQIRTLNLVPPTLKSYSMYIKTGQVKMVLQFYKLIIN